MRSSEPAVTAGHGISASVRRGAGTISSATPVARIGPNAVIQTGHALAAVYGRDVARLIYESAGLAHHLDHPPQDMIDEREPIRLFAAIRKTLPAAEADRVLAEAGHRTAHYILEYRIPLNARRLLPRLPPAVSARLLAFAITRHAWTFAGSGRFSASVSGWTRPVVTLTIRDNPLATPGCPWHGAVFKRLFATLAGGVSTVRHPHCCAKGEGQCVTELVIGAGG
ncbi:bacteriochlorophyll 4-vinyl reductase [Ciceribacter sp. L1K23]|uniref:bacteriochlorophyll 4-vinyl reductase n=1 Tax=Ciceribacter sp. L1K23 TaxID=2820276 RepID=UPI001BAB74A5|nr:bacteriochlorophyll 4-vinyl reductase [Ciceribacter sp. L1K23]